MRVLIWVFHPPSPDSSYWAWLIGGMEAAGHQVIAVDAFGVCSLFGPHRIEAILLAYARAYRVQAAVVVPQAFVSVAFLNALRAMGTAVIALRYDDGLLAAPGVPVPYSGQEIGLFRHHEAGCDLAVTTCRNALRVFAESYGPPLVYVPLPFECGGIDASERPLRPVIAYAGSPKFREDTPLSARVAIVRSLLAVGLPMELHHADWATIPGCEAAARPTPSRAAFFDIFRTSTVNLVLASDWGPRIYPMIKLLNMEIAAAGGMQLTSPCAELDDYFTADLDIAYATTESEFARQARYYLTHPDEARQLGRRSRRVIERRATWARWWQAVAGHLQAGGHTLDLTAPAVAPDPAEIPVLAAVAAALAHAHTAAGQAAVARVYFDELRRYDPGNASIDRGLARLADMEGRRPPVAEPPVWPGLGDAGHLTIAAAFGKVEAALRDGDQVRLLAAATDVCRLDPALAPALGDWLEACSEQDLATQVRALWPQAGDPVDS